jgi:two-component system, sensor histidine kinase and response regulator
LGLRISQAFVNLMGGEITVRSILGQGSCFTFNIPVRLTQISPTLLDSLVDPVPPDEPQYAPYRILIAEDNIDNRLLLSKLLGYLGFEVQEAANGQVAIALWEQWQPHLIFMDMHMPIMDGYEATRQIREREALSFQQGTSSQQPTKIIALTASAFAEQRQASLVSGCDMFVSKPFRREQILRILEDCLDVKDLQSSSTKNQKTVAEAPNSTLHSIALEVMSADWNAQLYHAAAQGNDVTSLKLIAQIPAIYTELIAVLTQLVENYQFDQLMKLTQSIYSQEG